MNYYDVRMVSEVFEEVEKLNSGSYIVGSNFAWASQNFDYYDVGNVYDNSNSTMVTIRDLLVEAAKSNGLNIDETDPQNIKFIAYP